MARRSVELALGIEKWIRNYQAALLVEHNREVSFNAATNYILAIALARPLMLAGTLTPEELGEAKRLAGGSAAEASGLFDALPEATRRIDVRAKELWEQRTREGGQ